MNLCSQRVRMKCQRFWVLVDTPKTEIPAGRRQGSFWWVSARALQPARGLLHLGGRLGVALQVSRSVAPEIHRRHRRSETSCQLLRLRQHDP